MLIRSHGVDLVELKAIRVALETSGQLYLDRLFSSAEQALVAELADPVPSYAGRFAAKEAVVKCLGTGWRDGVPAPEIEVLRRATGRPWLRMGPRIARLASRRGIDRWLLSISHTDGLAMASVLAISDRAADKV